MTEALKNIQMIIGVMCCTTLVFVVSCKTNSVRHRENGWYLIAKGEKDSIADSPIITVKDFIALELESDAYGTQVISGKICKQKQIVWADVTERTIGQQIGFVFNDTVITAPMVNARIESGTFQISNPHGYDLERIFKELQKEIQGN